jgi:NAD-dependent deacetylase
MGLLNAVITQNVDGLHQESGLADEKIIELHGNTRRIRCMTCRKIASTEQTHRRLESGEPAPECGCGGYLKPDTISFGQAMPVIEVAKATRLSQECDFFLVVGSTLLVQPAAHMPIYARQNGAFLVIVNLSETPCDDICDALIRDQAGKVLAEIVRAVEKSG